MTDDFGNTVTAPSGAASINQTVLEDKETHPAYMEWLRETGRIVGVIGLGALIIVGVLSWFGKPVPDVLASVPQWVVLILGAVLVGDALLGKLAVKA